MALSSMLSNHPSVLLCLRIPICRRTQLGTIMPWREFLMVNSKWTPEENKMIKHTLTVKPGKQKVTETNDCCFLFI